MDIGDGFCPVDLLATGLEMMLTGKYFNNILEGLAAFLELIRFAWPEPGGAPCEEYCLCCGKHGWPVWNALLKLYKDVCKIYSGQKFDLFLAYVHLDDLLLAVEKAQLHTPMVYHTSYFIQGLY